MVALTPEQSGWADVLTHPSHSEILEWALYMGNREGQALTAQNALRIIVTVREQNRETAVDLPVMQPADKFSPNNKWQWSRADAGGLYGRCTAWTELSARLLVDGHPRWLPDRLFWRLIGANRRSCGCLHRRGLRHR